MEQYATQLEQMARAGARNRPQQPGWRTFMASGIRVGAGTLRRAYEALRTAGVDRTAAFNAARGIAAAAPLVPAVYSMIPGTPASLKPPTVSMRRRAGYTRFHNRVCLEKKWKDISLSTTSLTDADGTRTCLVQPIAQGSDGDAERIGRQIYVHRIDIQGAVMGIYEPTDLVSQRNIKVALVLDKQANGTTPTWTQVFDGSSPFDFRNMDNTGRFKVLWSKNITLNNMFSSAATNTVRRQWSIHKQLRGLVIRYDASTGVTGTIKDNNLWLMIKADQDTTDNQAFFRCRIRYTD